MRQGNGTELLGSDDQRGASIGMIYVSPTDDRKGVLTAILTQEKLGRKQIAVVLPQQSRAFQRLQDFDDLKAIRNKVKAPVVFVIPQGSSQAEYARQRRFTVYHTKEEYADAIRKEGLPGESDSGKKGWFGFGKKKSEAAATGGAVAGVAAGAALASQAVSAPEETPKPPVTPMVPETPSPTHNPPLRSLYVDQETIDISELKKNKEESQSGSSAGTLAAGAAGGALAAQDLQKEEGADSFDPDDDAALPPLPGAGTQKSQKGAALSPNLTPAGSMQAETTVERPNANKKKRRTTIHLSEAAAGAVAGAGTAAPPPQRGAGRGPSQPLNRGARKSGQMSKGATTGAISTPAAAGVGTATLAARGAGANASSRVGASNPPVRGNGNSGGTNNGKKRPRWILILVVLLLLTGLLGGGVALSAQPQLMNSMLSQLSGEVTAKVKITPDSRPIQDTFLVQASEKQGEPDLSKRIVHMSNLDNTATSQTKEVKGNGKREIPATVATGFLTFKNFSSEQVTIPAGETFSNGDGDTVRITADVTIPPRSLTLGTAGSARVPAEAVNPGIGGNLDPLSINAEYRKNNNIGVVNEEPFTGGQNAKNYTFVKEEDFNAVVNPLKEEMTKQASNAVKQSLKGGENLVGNPTCDQPNVESSQPVGDQGQNVTSLTVKVSVTCYGTAYDANGVGNIAKEALSKKAQRELGEGYVLAGDIVSRITVDNPKNGETSITLNVTARGVWYYDLNQMKGPLAEQLAGKNNSEATSVLEGQKEKGIKEFTIEISNGGETLPSDPSKITIEIVPVEGAKNSDLPQGDPPVSGDGNNNNGDGSGNGDTGNETDVEGTPTSSTPPK